MSSSVAWYLENIIDYAGTFPPAALSARESVANYHAYRAGSESWIVGSLAWSCATLNELTPLLGGNDELELALIGRPSSTWEGWQDARVLDVEDFNKAMDSAPLLAAATYESRLPVLDKITDALLSLKPLSKETDVFIELPWDQPLGDVLAEIAVQEWARVKFRTGGPTKEAYPTPEQLATVIKECVDLEIEFKLTAGLHEPIAHIDSKNGAFAHGFLNVLMATAIAYSDDATIEEMTSVLASASPGDWSLKGGLSFNGRSLSEDELNDARSFFGSFGSCSIDEPLAGLAQLRS